MQNFPAPLTADAILNDVLELAALEAPRWPAMQAELRASGVPLNDYDAIVSRTDVASRIPEDVSDAMLTSLAATSYALEKFIRVPVAQSQTRFPILSALPQAYWVNGETGLKQTSEVAWGNKYLNIEELAVIVPIPEAVLDDTSFDVWGEIRPLMEGAIARAFDQTVFFGTNAPASFPTNVAAAAIAANNFVARGGNAAAAGGLAQDFSDLYAKTEAQGFDVDSLALHTKYKGLLRSVRDTTGRSLNDQVNSSSVHGVAPAYPMRKLFPASATGAVEGIAFDGTEFVAGVRKDFTYKILDQAVIQDNTGAIIYNLAQQDMVAMRLVFRAGWQCSNKINYDEPTEANRYPASVIRQP